MSAQYQQHHNRKILKAADHEIGLRVGCSLILKFDMCNPGTEKKIA